MARARAVTLVVALVLGLVGVTSASAIAQPASAAIPSVQWVHQLGSTGNEYGNAIGLDSAGNTYIAGSTTGTLSASPEANAGSLDIFVAKYDPAGVRLWVHQLGTTGNDEAFGISVDSTGNAYVTGFTDGTLPGSRMTNAGGYDVFVAKYDTAGIKQWVHQLGTTGDDFGYGIGVDSTGNAYVSGLTFMRLPGSPETNAGSYDVFVAKYDTAGIKQWVHQLGTTGDDEAFGISVDSTGNAYVTGRAGGTLPGSVDANAGNLDVFVAKYDAAGIKQWVHQLGTSGNDYGNAIGVDHTGNSYVTGTTFGTLPGSVDANAGNLDVFVAKYDAAGVKQWVRQLGAAGNDGASGVAVDSAGNSNITGGTDGTLPGSTESNAGEGDIFVTKYGPGSQTRSVSVSWTASENARVLQLSAYLNQSPEQVQKTAVYLLGFLIGFLPPNTLPQTLPTSGTAATYVSVWDSTEFTVIDSVTTKFVLNDSDATRLSFAFLSFLLGLSGN